MQGEESEKKQPPSINIFKDLGKYFTSVKQDYRYHIKKEHAENKKELLEIRRIIEAIFKNFIEILENKV